MTIEQLRAAADVLSWLRTQASETPATGDGGMVMAANLSLAAAYLTGYAEHLAKGRTPQEALVATARCEFEGS